MRTKLLALLCLAQLLVPALPAQASGTPAPAQAVAPKPVSLTNLTYPKAIGAGQTITFTAEVAADAQAGTCCGTIALQGPSGQYAMVDLRTAAPGVLKGSYTLDPHAEPGAWKVERLHVKTNSWEHLELSTSPTFSHSFTVIPSGRPADTKGPQILAVSMPASVLIGDFFEIKVQTQDDLSGTDVGYVTLQPGVLAIANGPQMKPAWRHSVVLRPTGVPGELAGRMLMEPNRFSTFIEIASLAVGDKAGNGTVLEAAGLAAAKIQTKITAKHRPVIKELTTSPYLNVLQPGELHLAHWIDLDRQYLTTTVADLLQKDRQAARELLVGEISQLRAVIDKVRTEVYTEPTSGLRFVPYATSGKWIVLNQAITQRNMLLTLTGPNLPPLTDEGLKSIKFGVELAYQVTGEDGRLDSLNGDYAGYYQTAAALVHLLSSDPILVAALKTPAHQVAEETRITELDLDLIYFLPIHTKTVIPKVAGSPILQIPLYSDKPLIGTLTTLYYQTGLHVGEALFSSARDPNRSQWWEPYLTLRGEHPWLKGEQIYETPATNLAADFVQAFMPTGTEFTPLRSYPSLTKNPKQVDAFRDLMKELLLAERPIPITSNPRGNTQVGLSDKVNVTVGTSPDQAAMFFLRRAYSNEAVNQALQPLQWTKESTTFQGRVPTAGDPFWFLLRYLDPEGRNQFRLLTYIQAPVLLDPIAAGTNRPSIKVTGTTFVGRTVRVGQHSVTAGADGRFALTVPLVQGENRLRVTADNAAGGVQLRVQYQPEAPVPLKWTIPTSTTEPVVFGEAFTSPYAIIQIGERKWTADQQGSVHLFAVLAKLGEHLIKVEVTDRYGNKTVHEFPITQEAPKMTPKTTP